MKRGRDGKLGEKETGFLEQDLRESSLSSIYHSGLYKPNSVMLQNLGQEPFNQSSWGLLLFSSGVPASIIKPSSKRGS